MTIAFPIDEDSLEDDWTHSVPAPPRPTFVHNGPTLHMIAADERFSYAVVCEAAQLAGVPLVDGRVDTRNAGHTWRKRLLDVAHILVRAGR